MSIPVVVPRLGWTMEQGVFVEWLKRDGDLVRVGEPIFVLEGEKATQDIEATDSGRLKISPTGPRPGDTVLVGATVGFMLAEGEVWDEAAVTAPSTIAMVPETENSSLQTAGVPVASASQGSTEAETRISPRARRVANELGVDWTELSGTGASGRIREADVRVAANESVSIPMVSSTIKSDTADPPVHITSNLRRTIADRMLASAQQTAAVTLTTQVDASHMVALRRQFQSTGNGSEVVPSFNDILVKLSAVALKQHPEVNSRWDEDRILTNEEVHIGIAVDTPAGLIVPVLRSVGRLTLRQVAVRSRDLIARSRERKVAAAELQGGTFTITNLGMFGVDAFTPLLNPPQAAILGVGRIAREPAVVDDQVVPRDRMTLSLTFDHRIIDGAPAARFLDSLARLITNPAPALIV